LLTAYLSWHFVAKK